MLQVAERTIERVDEFAGATLQYRAYRKIRALLMSGHFSPGEALKLRPVADLIGLGLMPVRGALGQLETEGALVSDGPRRTLRVPNLSWIQIEEIRDIRIALEGLAAERAAATISHAELRRIEALQADMDDAIRDARPLAYVHANWAFHTAAYEASGLDQLLALIEGLWLRFGPYVRIMAETEVESSNHHAGIVEALRRRDGKAARAAIGADISEFVERLGEHLAQRQTGARS